MWPKWNDESEIIKAYKWVVFDFLKRKKWMLAKAPKEDLIQSGIMGIVEASRKYNPSNANGVPFAPFARIYVRSRMQHCIHTHTNWVGSYYKDTRKGKSQIPSQLSHDAWNLQANERSSQYSSQEHFLYSIGWDLLDEKEKRAVSMRHGIGSPEASFNEIGRSLGTSGERAKTIYTRAIEKLREANSGEPKKETKPNSKKRPNRLSKVKKLWASHFKDLVSTSNQDGEPNIPGWHTLNEREKTAISMYCGIGIKGKTNKDVAKIIGVSEATVRRICNNAMNKLNQHFTEKTAERLAEKEQRKD